MAVALPHAMSAVEPFDLAAEGAKLEAERSIFISFTAILAWDCLASLPTEYRLMWKKQKWTPTRVLFFLNRYSALFVLVHACVYLVGTIPEPVCRRSWPLLLLGMDLVFVICDAILVLRVHAIYDRSRVVLAVLSVLLLAEIGVLVRSAFEVHPLNLPPVIREAIGFHGCAVVAPPDRAIRAAFLGWGPSLAMNVVILLLTLAKTLSTSFGGGNMPLLKQIQSDGLLYFFAVVTVNSISLAFAAQPVQTLQVAALPALVVLMSIACNRLILSIRARNPVQRSISVDLARIELQQ